MSGTADEFGRESRPTSVLAYVAFAFGAVGLFGAMMTDVIAVIGRHVSIPFLGSVEIAQACVVLVGGASLVAATIQRDHASVRVLTERMSPPLREVMMRFACLAAAAFFLVLTIGTGWIMWDLRNGAEQTELLALPVMALRGFWFVCVAFCTLMFLVQAFKRSTPQ